MSEAKGIIEIQDYWFAENDLHILDKKGKESVFTDIEILNISGGEPMGDAIKVTATFTVMPRVRL